MDVILMELLACPLCRGKLKCNGMIVCTVCGKKYRIADGVPILLADKAVEG
jgi:uncharacterized protein YbaR (Trm112 family)